MPTICSGGQADGARVFNTSGAPVRLQSPMHRGLQRAQLDERRDSLNQGRMQVDGLGIQSFGGGGRSSYIADISNAQEVTFTLSGSLGESETGGTTINIIPRTGGNRYSGNFFTAIRTATSSARTTRRARAASRTAWTSEYDVNGAYGGPIIRDRLWFYGAARRQDREQPPVPPTIAT